MNRFLYLNDERFSTIHLPESVSLPGEPHLDVFSFDGMKAEPLVDLHTGRVTGHEFLSMLPAGVCSETFFRHQSCTSLAELFLLQLMLSEGLTEGQRFFNLPVRVLLISSLCELLSARSLAQVVIEIQDPENLPGLSSLQKCRLRQNLEGFLQAGAVIFFDDVTQRLMPLLVRMSLPLSGLKISRQEFQSLCRASREELQLNIHSRTGFGTAFSSVAEGVETPEQSQQAKLAGFTHGQGWLWPAKSWQFAGVNT
ncbi:EAL domain-containing protein [Enterobacter roggenkampii]|uniref:EAL domain-containing protein n=1 Tax=Enterobacter roggenkampii TaxID=1812935 RepID=UPI003515E6DA